MYIIINIILKIAVLMSSTNILTIVSILQEIQINWYCKRMLNIHLFAFTKAINLAL